ncbi:hypothetical protein QFC21_002265 [Naganishia friedmannii]|uniref:Uncharacterized protein n=1 Tax=Naganishia friedmannii TaxID=89922 RepID=A0ACC2VXB5_9TREE|nr:hypothetical protein QFC21_002265 [Naganishia friedmannii]
MSNDAVDQGGSKRRRGAFIVFEGLDRCGKTTQVQRLTEGWTGAGGVKGRRFPDRTTPLGTTINAYLTSQQEMDDHAIHLLFSANRWELQRVDNGGKVDDSTGMGDPSRILRGAEAIERDLTNGISVIADRYAFSGIAFSAAKGLNRSWLAAPDANLPAPDLIIFLHLPGEAAAARADFGGERYETVDIQTRVRDEFANVREKVQGYDGRSGEWVDVDAQGSIEEVEERIKRVVDPLLKRMEGEGLGEIKRLWV